MQKTIERFDKEHKHFGGIIFPSDFNTDLRGNDNIYGSSIAQRIHYDLKREKEILKRIERDGLFNEEH